MPDVTIVTAVREAIANGRKESFLRCMRSVLAQRGVWIEYVIVDGASADGTRELISDFASE